MVTEEDGEFTVTVDQSTSGFILAGVKIYLYNNFFIDKYIVYILYGTLF